MKLVENVGELVDRAGKLARVLHELRHAAERDEKQRAGGCRAALGKHIQHSAENHYQGNRQVVDKVDRRPERGAVVFGVVIRVHRLAVALGEAFADLVLTAVGADGRAAGQHLLRVAVELAELLGTHMEQGPHAFGAEPREENRGRHRDGEHGNQRPGNLPHEDQRADDGVDARHHLHQVLRKRRVDGVDVVGNAADDVAGGVRVEIADRQRGELFKKLLPHRVDDALAEPDHQDGKQIGQDGRSGVADQHPADVFPNRVEVDAAFGRDGVDGVARILRTHQ